MSEDMVVWVRYTWNLRNLELDVEPPPSFNFRSANPAELSFVTEVVLSAYRSDPIWKPLMAGIEKRMSERIRSTFRTRHSDYIVAEFGGRIVAVSGIAKSHWTDQNLLTGICVLPDHQRKGVGKFLLGLSLLRLREMSLSEARVYTERGSLADSKIYCLYGSRREEGVDYPGLHTPPTE